MAAWRHGALTAAAAGLACAIVGWVVQRSMETSPSVPPGKVLLVALAPAGVVAGAVVGLTGSLLAVGSARVVASTVAGGAIGALCALGFAPGCALVLRAARKRTAARSPSLLSGCERRYVWQVAVLCLAAATVVELPDQIARTGHMTEVPQISGWLLAGLAALVASLCLADLLALLRVRRFRNMLGRAEPVLDAASPALARARRIDLGLGTSLRGLIRRANPYRDAERIDTLLVGDHEPSARAIGRAFLRSAWCVAAFAVIYGGHWLVAQPAVTFAVLEEWCLTDSISGCYYASEMVRRGDVVVDAGGRQRLLVRACRLGLGARHCDDLGHGARRAWPPRESWRAATETAAR